MRPQQGTSWRKVEHVLWVTLILVLWAGSSVWAFTKLCDDFFADHCNSAPVGINTEVEEECTMPFPGCTVTVSSGVELRFKNIGVTFTGPLTINGGTDVLIEGTTISATSIEMSGMDSLRFRRRLTPSIPLVPSTMTATTGDIGLSANDSVVVESSILDAAGDIDLGPDTIKIEKSDVTAGGSIQATAADSYILCDRSGPPYSPLDLGLTANDIDFSAPNGTVTSKKCKFTVSSESTMSASASLKVGGGTRSNKNTFECSGGVGWEFISGATADVRNNDFDACACECLAPKEKCSPNNPDVCS